MKVRDSVLMDRRKDDTEFRRTLKKKIDELFQISVSELTKWKEIFSQKSFNIDTRALKRNSIHIFCDSKYSTIL